MLENLQRADEGKSSHRLLTTDESKSIKME